MLIKGKEVVYDEKQAIAIQKTINQVDGINDDLKAEISPQNQEGDKSLDYGGWNIFDKEDEQLVSRKTRYTYFRKMDETEFVHRGLEIIADDSTQVNDDGNTIKVYSDDEKIKELLEDLFLERLDINNEIWSIIFETCQMGDNFYEILVDNYKKPKKVMMIRYLEPDKVERVEKNGKLSHFTYKTKSVTEEEKSRGEEVLYKLQPWQIVHFKLENRKYAPYGASLLYPGIKTFRRLEVLEDIMLVYRISRAPERRVFYIDVGNLNPAQAKQFMQKIKSSYRTQPFIDEDGKINRRAHMMSITSDIFVPMREGSGTKIETLAGGQALGQTDDLKYFKDKILRIMNIPPSYLGDETDRSRGSLAQLDAKFGRFIERVQAQIIRGLNKIAALELFFNKYKKEDLKDFQIELTPPSNIKEVTEIDIINQRMTLLANIQQLNIFSNEWMLRNILKMSNKEIADIELYKKLENPNGEGQPEEGGGMPPAMPGEETPPEEETGGVTAGAETGAEVPPEGQEATPEELTASTLIKVLGKDFIVENAKDFKKLVQFTKEHREDPLESFDSPILEHIVELFQQNDAYKKKRVSTNNVDKLLVINELGGLNFENGEMKLWEGKIYKTREKESGRYRTKKILRG